MVLRGVIVLVAGLLAGRVAAQAPPVPGTVFGSLASQPFNEKLMFPTAPAVPKPGKPVEDPPPIVIPDGSMPPPPPLKIWTGGFEFGINGAQGNTDVLNLRLGASADRKTADNYYHSDFLYTLNKQNGTTKSNQALLNARDEILFPDSPWSVFAAVQGEYDEFRSYDVRAGVYTGLSYSWLSSDITTFKTRAGAGAVREISTASNGPESRWVPEGLFGFDFNHKFTDRQSFMMNADIYPSLSQLGQYRVRTRAAYEIVIDPVHGVVLRLGVQDRYDTNPGSAKRNDLNYFATLLFKF